MFYFFVQLMLLFFFPAWMCFLLGLLMFYPVFFCYSFSFSLLSKNSFICLDYFSFILIILTFWIVFLSVFSSFYIMEMPFSNFFLKSFSLLMIFLVMFFLINNLFFFFFFFESTLIPTLYIIVGWGNNIERVQSGMYLFFYTLFGSMPMLVSIFFLGDLNSCLNFSFLESFYSLDLLYLFFIFSFMIKMPMFLVHSWLPKAHVEAPVSGSMILAGVLLKMGGYGIFRLSFIYKNFLTFNLVWIYISIWGGLVSSIICMRQVDLKSLIAFSSVAHMSMVIIGLLIYSETTISGSLMLMLAHGLCSSGLFFLANLIYERSGSRSLFLNKGLLSLFPSLSMWWFIFCSFNMACPPSLNLISEIFLINGLVSWSFFFVFFLMMISFMGGVYNLYLYTACNHGMTFSSISNFVNSCVLREYLILYLHFFPIFFFFLKLEFFF
uniref:NADH dehydrogenase subunit 4 n=1 Tax=Lefroyothrips lefroyi TaxID=1030666 RepID=UPI00292A3E6E|nr:NADH dehydrogenase subunit 4 [Lefroyothrips lefroyi]WNL54550.1 NADH dehydrogenase subunit 4 [Lefroyothrips lefroyi]